MYKTIKALRCYNKLFDIDSKNIYKVLNSMNFNTFGYFLLKSIGEDKWTILKELKLEKDLSSLPYHVRVSIYQFIVGSFYIDSYLQKEINSLEL